MGSINTLNAYGHVLEAWLSTSLDSTHLSTLPRLEWFDAEQLQRRIWTYIDPPADATTGLLALHSHYEAALLAMAGEDYNAETYRSYYTGTGSDPASTEEQVLQLNLSLSRTTLFDDEGRFLGDLSFLDADGRDLDLSVSAVLADPYNFENPDRVNDALVVLLPSALPDGITIQLDLDADASDDLTLGPLVYDDIPFSDPWQLDSFQLDLISDGERLPVPGRESTSEGWLDLDQNRVVLLGSDLSLKEGDLVQFGYDWALPDNIFSWLAYTVADLQSLETTDDGSAITFQLLESDSEEPLIFGDSDGITDSTYPFGIRLAPAVLEERLVAADLHSADNQRLSLDPAVLSDLRLQVRDDASSSWLDVPLASASAAWGELRINIEPSQELAIIPADWQVRLSYDDLLQESISADDLNAGVYLQFDDALINQILDALNSGELASASLSIGVANSDSLLSFGFSDYGTSTELYTAIGSAAWVSSQVETGVLQLQAPGAEQGLPAFTVQLNLGKPGGAIEPVYNAAQLVRADGSAWAAADPDGFSLWGEWDGGLVAIDRYGDQLDQLGNQPAGSEPPLWNDYHPWVSITGDLFKPWDEQRTSPKTIEIEGNAFDGGDDLLVNFSLELPDDPQTPEWEGEWRDYVLLFDLFSTSGNQLSEEERNVLFDQELYSDLDALAYEPRFTVPVDITAINGGDSLTGSELLDALASGLEDFLASEPAELSGFATPSFSLSSPTVANRNGRTLLEAVLDFPPPEPGALKPSVNLWSRVLDDPTNTLTYDAAWELYDTYTASNEQEWLNNYGSRAPKFRSAWTDPLSDAEAADRTITLDFSGLDPLADSYTPGDIRLRLNNKLVDPQLYSVENLWGYQLQITLNPDSGLQLSADSELSISLADGHSFIDTAGIPLATTNNLAVDNWAAWQSYGFNPDGQLLLDQGNSYADDKTIRLSFLGSAVLSLDTSQATVPESGDFQFWAYDYNDGTTTALELASSNPLKVDGKALVFSLANPLGSGLSVDVTYDASLDSTVSSDPFTNTKGVAAQAFYWQPIENRSPDKQGPSINWSSVFGNRLTLGLADPAGVWVGSQELSDSNLPAPADFLIKATDTDNGTSRTLTATSISLTPWGWNELELQLDASVNPGETLSLSYQGTSLQDGNGNLAELRQVPIDNHTVVYDATDASSWFQQNDLIKVVFEEEPGNGGFFLMENGSLSSTPENFQIQDDYSFSLSELSTLTVDLTDKAGGSLDDPGDANLDFSLENLRTQSFIGGSWNSLEDSWLGDEASNDERDVKFVLPPGDYRLSVMHADLWQEIAQSYQLDISHSPFSLTATQLDTNEGQLIDTTSATLSESLYLDLLDPGQFTATLPEDSSDAWLDLYDLNGQWMGSSTGESFSQYVLAGLYRLEVDSWSPVPTDAKLSLELDSSISLNTDTDSPQAPSGKISVNGLPSKGDLNPLDRDDYWTLKLNGGQIYSLRASGFSDDVNLIVNDAQGFWVADSWNWGTYAEDGSFVPSDETIVLDLSDQPAGTYSYTVQLQTWGFTPTKYSLTAKSHSDRAKAEEEAARGVINYDSLFDDFFGDNSDLAGAVDFSKDDLEDLAGLQAVSTDKLREVKASLEKQGFAPSGTVLAFQSTLAGSDPNPLLISKSAPQALPQDLRDKLAAQEPGELSEQQSQLQFGPKQVAALVNDTKDEASGVEPVSKPVGVTVESRQGRLGGFLAQDATSNQLMAGPGLAPELEGDDLGLQRIAIPLDDDTRAALSDPANAAKTLVWYKTPASGEAWLFTYDDSTDTGSRLEDTDPNQEGPDVLALYVQDGGRGDDDGEVNGEIVTPGGLALAQLDNQNPINGDNSSNNSEIQVKLKFNGYYDRSSGNYSDTMPEGVTPELIDNQYNFSDDGSRYTTLFLSAELSDTASSSSQSSIITSESEIRFKLELDSSGLTNPLSQDDIAFTVSDGNELVALQPDQDGFYSWMPSDSGSGYTWTDLFIDVWALEDNISEGLESGRIVVTNLSGAEFAVDTSSNAQLNSATVQVTDADDGAENLINHAGFSSAFDIVQAGASTGADLPTSLYPNAYTKQQGFLDTLKESSNKAVTITFEPDNGWIDVDGETSGTIHRILAGSDSSYSESSPYQAEATGRTTLITGTATGNHNPDGNAAATIQFLEASSAGDGVRVDFSLNNIGNYISGLDEPGLAKAHEQINIDRGTNTTTTGIGANQFLEIVPSENAEGGLTVSFAGLAADGSTWSNPAYAFGFYLMGRENKRDVYLDVYDTEGTLIHSSNTQEPGASEANSAMIEYISFAVNDDENPISSFSLREEYTQTSVRGDRDIFSIDDLTFITSSSDITAWNADIDGDNSFSPLSDGLALMRRFSEPDLEQDPLISGYAAPGSQRGESPDEMLKHLDEGIKGGFLDVDGSGTTDDTDLQLTLRYGFGTFPGQALTGGLELSNTNVDELIANLQSISPLPT